MKSTRALQAAAFFLAGTLLLAPASVAGQGNPGESGIGGRPANPDRANPRTASIFVFSPKAGDTIDSAVTVFNNTSGAKTILVYGVDAEIASEGAFACKQRVEPKEEAGGWMKFSQSQLALEPGANKNVSFKISVPEDLPAGEYNGCVVVQEKRDPQRSGNGVALSFRNAIRVVLTIPGALEKRLDILELKVNELTISAGEEKIVLHPVLRNEGTVSLDTEVKVSSRGIFGIDRFATGGTFPILRRTTAEYNFEKPRPALGGFYQARVEAAYDPDPKHQLGMPGAKTASAEAVSLWYWVWPVWWAALLEIAILSMLLYPLFRFVRSRRQARTARRKWREYAVKPGETVQDIATRGGVSWKTLAKVNGIKAPYALETGRKIRVPAGTSGTSDGSPAAPGGRKPPRRKLLAKRANRPKKRP